MKKALNILLAIDGNYDDQALLAEVASVARNNRSSVTILNLNEPLNGNNHEIFAVSNLQEREGEIRSSQLKSLSTALSEKGIQVTVEHVTGKPHLEIIRRTLDNDFDLVMKPARREVGLKQFLIGGTDVQLLSLCPVPVWIFQPTINKTLKKIAVAVDLNPTDKERTALAISLLKWGNYFATLVGAELHVVHVWNLYRESSLRSAASTQNMIDKLLLDTEQLHRQWLSDVLKQAGLLNHETHKHLCKGDPKQVIPTLVADPGIDLLIMGTVGRTGIPGFFIGNTADSVLRRVSCSVLAIKPENFVTPVEPEPEERNFSAGSRSWQMAS